MTKVNRILALPLLAIGLATLPALAQDQDHHDQAQSQERHDNGSYRQHKEWKRGSRIQNEDWQRGDKVDYRSNHLRQPPEGHEWRQIDGNYVLANQDGTIVETRRARNHRMHDEHPQ